MQKYRLITENVLDGQTGELSTRDFREIIPKSNLKRGFRMVYAIYEKAQLNIIKSNKDMHIFLYIKSLFAKTKVEVRLPSEKIAKKVTKEMGLKVSITPSKVSTVIKRMVEEDLLMRVEVGLYRLNPFAYLPYQSDGVALQKEWNEIKIKEKEDE